MHYRAFLLKMNIKKDENNTNPPTDEQKKKQQQQQKAEEEKNLSSPLPSEDSGMFTPTRYRIQTSWKIRQVFFINAHYCPDKTNILWRSYS